jgi:hypothetical protein
VIEREIPGIDAWSPQQFQKAAEKSRAVLREMGLEIQWLTRLPSLDAHFASTGATARRPVAWMAGRRETKALKPIDETIGRMGASDRAVT